MLSVDKAKKLIAEHCVPGTARKIHLTQAVAGTLAADIIAPIDLPPFNQSSMDGYALAIGDHVNGKPFRVVAVSQAGEPILPVLKQGESSRIFTGAPVPAYADTVIMQEHARIESDELFIEPPIPGKGANMRLAGAEVARGAVALSKGALLTPSAIGFLAGMGISEVEVYAFPKITVLITGNELSRPGEPLAFGQVYESTSFALKAALKNLPADLAEIVFVKDDRLLLAEAIKTALLTADILLITGGVSVGDFDFTTVACTDSGVQTIFHGVKQKPGKPLYFGTKDSALIFGLPGNPSSVLSCFHHYVRPSIGALSGRSFSAPEITVPFTGEYRKNKGLTHFLKGRFENSAVRHLPAQESYRLSSFALSNCLIRVNEDTELVETGDKVTICLLDC